MKRTKHTLDQDRVPLALIALGVVFGDIGTSPLYAMRESLDGLPINLVDVLGVLSLILWSLIIVISIKYCVILFRADNDGEGGILSLLALLNRISGKHSQTFFLIAIFGAGLMLGDGMLTPAISVISAIEGLHVIVPSLSNWIIPATVVILLLLFSVQSLGTAKIGFIFGPLIFIWFCTIAILGGIHIVQNPTVFKAINPLYAIDFFRENGWHGFTLLGGVFLVVTGGEALYADLGHFGRYPIRFSWFFIALPSLVLNYFGQGAYLLLHPEGIINPFYKLAPEWFSIPLLIIATFATIIASQAVISATFSLTRQAVLMGLYPHLPIIPTSGAKVGQIYVPQMNLILGIGTLLLVLTFKNSNALTHAYGIAVNMVMVLTSFLIFYLAIKKWNWGFFNTILLFCLLFIVDLSFLIANMQKMGTGGWVPTVFALFCAFIMYTWHKGTLFLRNTYYMKKAELSKILRQLDYKSLNRLPNTLAIFITDIYDKSGGSFLHFLKLNRALPEHILIVNYSVENVPYVDAENRFVIHCLKENICELTLQYGFMDTISIPEALSAVNERKLLSFEVNAETANYLIEIPNVVASRKKKTLWFFWQEKLFAFLVRNYSANLNIEFYHLPFNKTIAIGTYYMI